MIEDNNKGKFSMAKNKNVFIALGATAAIVAVVFVLVWQLKKKEADAMQESEFHLRKAPAVPPSKKEVTFQEQSADAPVASQTTEASASESKPVWSPSNPENFDFSNYQANKVKYASINGGDYLSHYRELLPHEKPVESSQPRQISRDNSNGLFLDSPLITHEERLRSIETLSSMKPLVDSPLASTPNHHPDQHVKSYLEKVLVGEDRYVLDKLFATPTSSSSNGLMFGVNEEYAQTVPVGSRQFIDGSSMKQ